MSMSDVQLKIQCDNAHFIIMDLYFTYVFMHILSCATFFTFCFCLKLMPTQNTGKATFFFLIMLIYKATIECHLRFNC